MKHLIIFHAHSLHQIVPSLSSHHHRRQLLSENENLATKTTMLRSIIRSPLNLTAAMCRRQFPSSSSPYRFFCSEKAVTQLTRLPSLLEGCDYQHWFVVMEAPKGYPLRDEIVNGYVKTLAMALGSEEEAKKSMYSVSTKYYYAFGCKVSEDLTYKIRSLPNVKWVLPDSYLCHGESGYGGEPFVNGDVVPYDDKYHMDWIRDQHGKNCKSLPYSRKARRKRQEKLNLTRDVQ